MTPITLDPLINIGVRTSNICDSERWINIGVIIRKQIIIRNWRREIVNVNLNIVKAWNVLQCWESSAGNVTVVWSFANAGFLCKWPNNTL